MRPAAQTPRGHATVTAREYLDALLVAGLVALFLITFVVRTFYIPSGSMEPTLRAGDVLLVNELSYRLHLPRRGDIVVFRPPVPSKSDFIKRIVAIPGDTFSVRGGKVIVNGSALDEPYVAQQPQYTMQIARYGIVVDGAPLDPATANVPPRSAWQAPDRVPAGYYVTFGDNRNRSDDSHVWGFAQMRGAFANGPLANTRVRAEFAGRAFFLFWPFDRLRILN